MAFPSDDESLPRAALIYASRGWPVLPLKPRDKRPLTEHGCLDASDDAETVTAWWSKWPDANIGLRTGVAFDVLDIDGEEGNAALQELVPGYHHAGPIASTGKGHHLLFQTTSGKNGAKLLPQVDFRGVNGYIVAPPSIHPSGSKYRWVRTQPPMPAEPTIWLLDLVLRSDKMTPNQRPTSALHAGLRDKTDIVAAFNDVFPGEPVRRLGSRWVMRCQFHNDRTPSLVLYPENQTFYCFGCGAWGDAINLELYRREGRLR